jgi:hypothetical protein
LTSRASFPAIVSFLPGGSIQQRDNPCTRKTVMRLPILALLILPLAASAADVESRVLTHYVPQDLLEAAVRKEGWTEVPLAVMGGVRKGDVVRLWAGGSIDRGNNEQPGENTSGPAGPGKGGGKAFALSSDASHAHALLIKQEGGKPVRCQPAGKALEITLTRDNQRLSLGFNDLRGRYADNHIGKGRRHEHDPLWVRVEVVRIVVD